MSVALRPYQQTGLNAIRRKLAEKLKAVLYVLATGGGKTVIYAAMAHGASQKANNTLILEHRKELIKQASLALARMGVKHRIIAPPNIIAAIRKHHIAKVGWPMIDNTANVAVASVQTLARRMDWLLLFNPRIIIIDEAHHSKAKTWNDVIKKCADAVIVGVTATPITPDGGGLGDIFDCMVLGPPMQWLIDEGYLVPFRIVVPPRKADPSHGRIIGGDVSVDDQAAILDKPHITGDAVQHYAELTPGKRAIVFCTNVKHANHVADAFKADGWRFEVITGEMDDDIRDSRISGLENGTLDGIVTVGIVEEGTDIVAAEVAIMLRFTQSERLFKQQAGRVGRPVYAPGYDLTTREGRLDSIAASGKQFGFIIDHVGNVGVQTDLGFEVNHGSPSDPREWVLHAKKKRARGTTDEKEIKIRMVQCPKCYGAAAPRAVCGLTHPATGIICKYEFPVGTSVPEQVAGKLVEITPELLAAAEARKAQGKARTIAQLKAMGVSDSRAAYILAAREEKDKLRAELKDLMAKARRAGIHSDVDNIYDLKPKALRAEIERLISALGHVNFMGADAVSEAHA